MILSASRRTDIPCHYAEWFINRLRAGYALVRNPMNHAQISRVPLTKDVVDAVVFWTKDAENLTPHLDEIERMGFPYCFQFTITPYGRNIEPGLRGKQEIVQTFIDLSRRIGKKRMLWRYDPILLTGEISVDWHIDAFRRYAEVLAPYARHVTISFVDSYAKLRNVPYRTPDEAEIHALAAGIGEIAAGLNLPVQTCSETCDLSSYGIGHGACIDRTVLEDATGYALSLAPDKNQRGACGCMESVDIGAYNSCTNGCIYCYANRSAASAAQTLRSHVPTGELLLGDVLEGARITERKVCSNRNVQLRMTDI